MNVINILINLSVDSCTDIMPMQNTANRDVSIEWCTVTGSYRGNISEIRKLIEKNLI